MLSKGAWIALNIYNKTFSHETFSFGKYLLKLKKVENTI